MYSTYGSGIRRAGLVAADCRCGPVVGARYRLCRRRLGDGALRPCWRRSARPGLPRWPGGRGIGPPAPLQRAEGLVQRRVRVIQRVLTRLGKRPGPVDGLFGPLTEAGVVRFQRSVGIAADGVVGRQTARQLLAAATRLSDTRLARNPGAARDTGRFASARLPRGGTVDQAAQNGPTGLGASVSQAAAPGQEEEVEPALMLALALPLLLVSALLGALRGRVTPAREPKTNGGTMNNSVMIPAAPRPAPETTGHSR